MTTFLIITVFVLLTVIGVLVKLIINALRMINRLEQQNQQVANAIADNGTGNYDTHKIGFRSEI